MVAEELACLKKVKKVWQPFKMQFDFSVVIVDKGLVAVLEGVSCKKKYEGIFFFEVLQYFYCDCEVANGQFSVWFGWSILEAVLEDVCHAMTMHCGQSK